MGAAAEGRAQRLLQALSASESAAAGKDLDVSAALQQAADAHALLAAEKAGAAATKLDNERARQEMRELSDQCSQVQCAQVCIPADAKIKAPYGSPLSSPVILRFT